MLNETFTLLDDFPPVDYDQWRAVVDKDLAGAPFEKKLVTHTYEGIDIQPVYTGRDWSQAGNPSGFAGMAPYTRGSRYLANAVAGWDIRQQHDHPDTAAANRAILTDLQRGVTSLQLRFDVAARRGRGPDAADHAGRDGLMVYALSDLEQVLRDVYLDAIGIALEAGAAFLPASALLVALWRRRGTDFKTVRGAFNADPLAVLARDGELPMPLDGALQQMADLAAWTSRHVPHATSIRVGTGPYHHAGATAAQDLGFSMATAVAYLRAATEKGGLDVTAVAKQMLFAYSIGTNAFLAIAKLRAARKLWARVLEASGAECSADAGTLMTMHVRTSKRVLTQRDPWVNMLRNTVTTFAAGVSGAQVVTTEPFDAALGQPNDFSRRIARNTQVILQEESHLNRVVDPAGGCWFIEALTDELADKAWAFFQDIESRGGMAEALTSGWVNEQIDSAFQPRLKNIAHRRDAVTGVSEFPNLAEKPIQKQPIDTAALRRDALTRQAARKPAEVETLGSVDAVIDAAGAGATIQQMAEALAAPGDRTTITPLSPHPYARPFEALRDASDAWMAQTGSRPKVFLANMGPIAHFTARASYSKNFFEAGGFEITQDPQGHRGASKDDNAGAAQSAGEAFDRSGASIAVICSSDVIYPAMVPILAQELKTRGARTVILAGHPGEKEAEYREAGVDRFIFMKCDVLGTLRDLLAEEGVLK